MIYRKGVGVLLLNPENKIFVGARLDLPGTSFQPPQGGIDGDETPREAVYREALEEIGTNNMEILKESLDWFQYDFPEELRTTLFKGNCIGQKQKWFVARFLGQDHEINIETADPEFKAWKWENPALLVQQAVYFKQKMYSEILAWANFTTT